MEACARYFRLFIVPHTQLLALNDVGVSIRDLETFKKTQARLLKARWGDDGSGVLVLLWL